MGFPGGTVVKSPPANAGVSGDLGLIPESGRFPGGGNGNPLQYSCLENPRDGGAWLVAVYGVAQSQTQLKRLSSSSSSSSYCPGPGSGVRGTWGNGDLAWAGCFVIEINEEVRLGYLETRI